MSATDFSDERWFLKLPNEDEFMRAGAPRRFPRVASVIPSVDEITQKAYRKKFEFILHPSEDQKRQIEEIERIFIEELKERKKEYVKRIEGFVEDALRTRIKPLLKGEITRGKVRYRGLTLIYADDGLSFIGILQRNKTLYCVDGKTYEITDFRRVVENGETKIKISGEGWSL